MHLAATAAAALIPPTNQPWAWLGPFLPFFFFSQRRGAARHHLQFRRFRNQRATPLFCTVTLTCGRAASEVAGRRTAVAAFLPSRGPRPPGRVGLGKFSFRMLSLPLIARTDGRTADGRTRTRTVAATTATRRRGGGGGVVIMASRREITRLSAARRGASLLLLLDDAYLDGGCQVKCRVFVPVSKFSFSKLFSHGKGLDLRNLWTGHFEGDYFSVRLTR